MILRRLSTNLRWMAITIEFVLLLAGVYLGILAANWNLQRLEKQETVRLLSQLDREMTVFVANLDSIAAYYRVTDRFAAQAAADWRGDSAVDDSEFAIAAYQASQS